MENSLGLPYHVLSWWRSNSFRFPILSQLASDVLAMQVSYVASESGFSTSGRVLNPYRSSLTEKSNKPNRINRMPRPSTFSNWFHARFSLVMTILIIHQKYTKHKNALNSNTLKMMKQHSHTPQCS